MKPFAFAELLARLRALLRRNLPSRELVAKALDLEVDLLRYGVPTKLIYVKVMNLCKKIERPNRRQIIHTVRGVGYMMRDSHAAVDGDFIMTLS